MKDILEEILENKRAELVREKAALPPASLYAQVERQIESELEQQTNTRIDNHGLASSALKHRSMRRSLHGSATGIIAEFKRKSPSKGWIKEDGRADIIPAAYAEAGAAALSILTDADYFGGAADFIRTARPMVSVPILRKEFIVDEYQLYQARLIGADAVLLIAAALTIGEYAALARKARELGLEVLLEVHGERELDYPAAEEPDMLGVNNRNLGTFHTDVENSFRIASLLPSGPLLVSESGISRPETVRQLRQAGFRGFLMGEAFMRQPDPGAALRTFIQQLEP